MESLPYAERIRLAPKLGRGMARELRQAGCSCVGWPPAHPRTSADVILDEAVAAGRGRDVSAVARQ